MITHFECIPCIINSYLRLVASDIIPEANQEVVLRQLLEFLSRADYNQSPPVTGGMIHRLIRESLKDPDPYLHIKHDYNNRMMELYPSLKEMVKSSMDPFDTALRLAVAGNVIDFGAKYQFDVMTAINRIQELELAVDDSRKLLRDLEQAETLLYIGDNCGEIVLDRLFIETIDLKKKYFVVRERPVINDITLDDAKMTGMDKVATVISTGDDSPGAVWESASKDFKEHFINADVVISKGQGNLEGLIDIPHDHIYYILAVKCDLIAEKTGTNRGDYIVKKRIVK